MRRIILFIAVCLLVKVSYSQQSHKNTTFSKISRKIGLSGFIGFDIIFIPPLAPAFYVKGIVEGDNSTNFKEILGYTAFITVAAATSVVYFVVCFKLILPIIVYSMVTCSISKLFCLREFKTIKQRIFCNRVHVAQSRALNLFDTIEDKGQKIF